MQRVLLVLVWAEQVGQPLAEDHTLRCPILREFVQEQ